MAISSQSIRVLAEPVRSVAFGSVSGTYMGIGSPLDHPSRIIFVQNLTDELLMFSFDGVNDHFPLPSNGFLLVDISSNKTSTSGFFLSEGQRLYVRDVGVAPGSGSVYFSTFYGSNI